MVIGISICVHSPIILHVKKSQVNVRLVGNLTKINAIYLKLIEIYTLLGLMLETLALIMVAN